MLTPTSTVRVYVCSQPADMRRSFDGLARMVEEILQADPLSGHVFVFRNRRGHLVKILWWDRSGYAIYYKRLEQGTFSFPVSDDGYVEMEPADLMLLLEGITLEGARRRARFQRGAPTRFRGASCAR